MNLLITAPYLPLKSAVKITGSKSESNRLLVLQALYPRITIKNNSDSDDSIIMREALQTSRAIINVHHAGTAMRFLTAFFAIQEGREVVITGSQRMQERPIAILVDALRQLGADIAYEANEGFPPLRIKGKKLTANNVTLAAHVSSQYISALLLIAPKLPNGITLTLTGKLTSVSYITMTLGLLKEIGVNAFFQENVISIQPLKESALTLNEKQHGKTLTVESDWSSASYFYSIIALAEVGTEITLSYYKQHSLQGDAVVAEIYKNFGVSTTFENNNIRLRKEEEHKQPSTLNLELSATPDIAQTIAVTCFGLGISCRLTGLHTLKIKETDRLKALKTELSKLGAEVEVTDDKLFLKASTHIHKNIAIETYNDHRMAMAFTPLAIKTPIIIKDAQVVSKSYPDFWTAMKTLQFTVENVK